MYLSKNKEVAVRNADEFKCIQSVIIRNEKVG